MEKFEFENLEVYQKSLDFIDQVYELTSTFPKDEQFGLIGQFRRAAISIALNIAEGAGRYNRNEKKHFYRMSRSSINECVAISQISNRRDYLEEENLVKLSNQCRTLAKMLSGLISSVQNPPKKKNADQGENNTYSQHPTSNFQQKKKT